jgi:hypothetical protein
MVTKKRRPPRTNDPREIEAWRRGQDDDNFDKIDKVPDAEPGNIPEFDGEGGLVDSGDSIDDIETRSTRRAFFFARNY